MKVKDLEPVSDEEKANNYIGKKVRCIVNPKDVGLITKVFSDAGGFIGVTSHLPNIRLSDRNGKWAEIVTEEKEKDDSFDKIYIEETRKNQKEQIRTELINELIEKLDGEMYLRKGSDRTVEFLVHNKTIEECINLVRSLLPTETPEKIAERKAVEMMNENLMFWTGKKEDEVYEKRTVKQMLIDIQLTDIKK